MTIQRHHQFPTRVQRTLWLVVAIGCLLWPGAVVAQGLTGTLIGTVRDADGGVLQGATVRVSSPALIGGPRTVTTNDKGQLRFPSLPPGSYALDIELTQFGAYHEEDIPIGAGATIERLVDLRLASLATTVVVEGAGSRIDARDPGFGTRFGPHDIKRIPTRRSSMFDFIRASPGISPMSPGSGTTTTVSAFGSSTNENQFLIDGTNFTCPCNGISRSEPGIDFIQEIHVQSIGASAEFGNVQGAVINVITRQGSERFLYDASYYGQTAGLTSQPIRLPVARSNLQSGYERDRYRDLTTNLGGPVVRDRLWFFAGYQYLRDYDSQPGADPAFPRTYEQNKGLGKLTWRLAPGWQLQQSVHYEHWVNPDPPTAVTPFEATLRRSTSVPAITFAHLTHTSRSNTVWDVRVGRFVFSQDTKPSTGDLTTPSRNDSVTGVTSGAPPSFSELTIARTTVKATLSHFSPGLMGADHQWKIGSELERGGHHAINGIPTGVRYIDAGGRPSQSVTTPPFNVGAMFDTVAAFVSDAVTLGDRVTINAGLRYDYTRAYSQDLPALDAQAHETDEIVSGQGTLYSWNLLSPRLGVTAKLTADGRTVLRGSYGRFSQGVLTAELELFHPGSTSTTMADFVPETGGYTQIRSVVDPRVNLRLDSSMRAPTTDEYLVGLDRELGRRVSAAIAYVHKDGGNFIGWTDVGGQYREESRTLPDNRTLPVFALTNGTAARRFLLTNPDGYSLTYNGLVIAVDKRRSDGWQAFGSYTFSNTHGLMVSSGGAAAALQVSTVAPPQPLTFGRDPNDLTNARGRLLGDRPHVFRVMASGDVPRTGLVVAANLQYFSGKPWAASALVALPQSPQQRVLVEPRGSHRLSSQTLLDVRLSRTFSFGGVARVELLLDVLNALNDTAEEAYATDNFFSPTFGLPTVFMDPRRAMLGVRFNLGR